MSDHIPRILDPSGLPVSQGEAAVGTEILTHAAYSLQTGRSVVKMKIPGTDTAFVLLPTEAMQLGLRLIVESEKALSHAVFMRCATEIWEAHPHDAMQILVNVGAGTRADHALVYEHALKAREAAKKMAEEPNGSGDTGTAESH